MKLGTFLKRRAALGVGVVGRVYELVDHAAKESDRSLDEAQLAREAAACEPAPPSMVVAADSTGDACPPQPELMARAKSASTINSATCRVVRCWSINGVVADM